MTAREDERTISQLKQLAKKVGIESNPLFKSTISQYQLQLTVINQMRESLNTEGDLTVVKEYIRGKENQYASPIIRELPRHCDSATKTATLLWRMIKDSKKAEDDEAEQQNCDGLDSFLKTFEDI